MHINHVLLHNHVHYKQVTTFKGNFSRPIRRITQGAKTHPKMRILQIVGKSNSLR